MPEGDTIHRTAAALRTAVLGKPVTAFEAPRLRGLRPSLGAVIERVESRGKHLEIGFDDGVVLHTHMRMTGAWHLYRTGEQWRKSTRQARVIIEVPGWQAVCFSAPVVRTYRAREFAASARLAELGPDLCRPDADLAEGVARIDQLVAPDTTVAEVLLDQRIACGVGNVYKSEVLWVCELHPFTPIGALLPEQRAVLLATAAQLLQANLDRPERVTVPGVPGGVAVYGRHQKPCFRCGTPVEVAKHGEHARVTYWCPSCQLLPAVESIEAGESDAAGRDAGDPWWREPEPEDRGVYDQWSAEPEGKPARPREQVYDWPADERRVRDDEVWAPEEARPVAEPPAAEPDEPRDSPLFDPLLARSDDQ